MEVLFVFFIGVTCFSAQRPSTRRTKTKGGKAYKNGRYFCLSLSPALFPAVATSGPTEHGDVRGQKGGARGTRVRVSVCRSALVAGTSPLTVVDFATPLVPR